MRSGGHPKGSGEAARPRRSIDDFRQFQSDSGVRSFEKRGDSRRNSYKACDRPGRHRHSASNGNSDHIIAPSEQNALPQCVVMIPHNVNVMCEFTIRQSIFYNIMDSGEVRQTEAFSLQKMTKNKAMYAYQMTLTSGFRNHTFCSMVTNRCRGAVQKEEVKTNE
jgi:hypothetical protein